MNKLNAARLLRTSPNPSSTFLALYRHQVDTNAAQRFADAHLMPLFETSAKDESESDNVEAIFLTLAHKLKVSKPMMTQDYPLMKRATVLSVDTEVVRNSASAGYCAFC